MKVKDLLPERDQLKLECENISKLERLFKDNEEIANEVSQLAELSVPLEKLIMSIRESHYNALNEINSRIENAVVDNT